LSHSNDGHSPGKGLRPFHTSESWFRERSWTIWNGAPGPTLTGRVAWLIKSTG
jgi:hypothetical protein